MTNITEDYLYFSKTGERLQESELIHTIKIDTSEFKALIDGFSDQISRVVEYPQVPVKLLTPTSKMPTRGSKLAIGLDLYSDDLGVKPIQIYPGTRRMIPTGVSMAIPKGYYGRVAPRSGLALKHGIDVLAGVIDADYRGQINVILQNNDSHDTFYVESHMRIAQIIFERADMLDLIQVDDLDATDRGEGACGSTGIK